MKAKLNILEGFNNEKLLKKKKMLSKLEFVWTEVWKQS